MLIRYGYELGFQCWQPTLMLCLLDSHDDHTQHICYEAPFSITAGVPSTVYRDSFGNKVRKFMAPAGDVSVSRDFIIRDAGLPDPVIAHAREVPIEAVPDEYLIFLLGSRYCETDKLGKVAWDLFGSTTPGWERVQAICDFVNAHVTFGYEHARSTRTAFETYEERVGVCRDFAHLAVALCRCMNIPARYANGFLGDIGVPPDPAPMDYNAWLEVYLDHQWYTFDARHNIPRIGRVTVARGRDATDIPLATSFGPHILTKFRVWTEEVDDRLLQDLTRQSA